MIGRAFDRGPDHPYQILCLGAHSDDIEIGCAGTLLRIRDAFPEALIRWVVFSGAGTPRENETRTAANRLFGSECAPEIDVLGFEDGFFPFEGAVLKKTFETTLKHHAPDLVFTHYREDRHQDHRLLSDLTWNTFRRSVILEYEILKYDGDLGRPGLYVPLSEKIAERKVDTLASGFASQQSKEWFTAETFMAMMRVRGVECGYPFAEAFFAPKIIW